MGGSDNKGDGLASQPRRYRVPGQPVLNRHQVGGVSRSPDGLFAQQEWEPIRGRPAVRGKRAYGGRPGQRVEEGTWAAQKHSEAGDGRPVDRGAWTAKTVKRPRQQPAHPQYANYWAPLTRKRHTMPHPAQSQHANYWAPRTRKRHQQEHRPQRPTESSNPTQHAKGRTGDRPGPRKGATTRRNVTQGGYVGYIRKALEKGYLEHLGLHAVLTTCLRFLSLLDDGCVACCARFLSLLDDGCVACCLLLSTGSCHVCMQIRATCCCFPRCTTETFGAQKSVLWGCKLGGGDPGACQAGQKASQDRFAATC